MKNVNILLIDDIDSEAELIIHQIVNIETYKFHIDRISKEHLFQEILHRQTFQLVLCKHDFNGFNGLFFLQTVKNQNLHIPFIFISSHAHEEEIVEAMRNGAFDFITLSKIHRLPQVVQDALFSHPGKSISDQPKFKISQALKQSPSAVVILDTDGKIEFINDKFTEISGFMPSDVLGISVNSGQTVFLPQESYWQIVNTIINGDVWYGDVANRRKDGSKYWTQITISPFKNGRNEIVNFIAVVNDITDRKNMESELVKAKKIAERANQLKTVFLQNMSHEICTPLNAIVGFTSLLAEKNIQDDPSISYMNIILNNSYQLLAVINDILTISKIQNGDQEISNQHFNLNQLLDSLFTGFHAKAKSKGVELKLQTSLTNSRQLILSDQHKLNEILSNLLNNALKFTHQGSIEFGYELKNDYLEFFVNDTGIGIPEDCIANIFESFSQADLNTRIDYGGIGLGLTISKSFVELFGGRIWVNSLPGKGSQFYFTIPYHPRIVQDEKVLLEQHRSEDIILVADDESFNFILIREMLKKHQVKLLHALNGKEAVEFCKQYPNIRLVFLDIRMPEMGGLEAVKLIREFNPDLPVIAQTAFPFEKVRNQILECGFTDYLSKPIDRDILISMVRKYLPGIALKTIPVGIADMTPKPTW